METDGLLDELTRIHTMHVIDLDDGRPYRFNGGTFADGSPAPRDGTIEDGLAMLQRADGLIGHNIIGFDIPAIQKLYPGFTHPELHDTLIYARLIYPHIGDIDMKSVRRGRRPEGFGKLIGSHSLKAWGIRIGVMKDDYAGGWSEFTQDMEAYAAQDVVATRALWERLVAKEFPEEALRIEHRVASIIFRQERHGFKFDRDKAEDLLRILTGRKAELEDQLRESFPPWMEPERKGGRVVQFIPKRDNARLGYTSGVPVTKVKVISFNPASRDHIANRMTALFGWQPVEFTDGGKPKVDETTLDGLDYPEAKLLVEYLTVEKRLGALAEGKNAWLRKVRQDGRIHGRVNTLGAITRRMTHSDPNMAQVPALFNASGAVPYGAECRGLFGVAPGRLLVGCDAEGLELRMLGHYMARHDGGAYAETVINGKQADGTDVHTVNQKVVGLRSRSSAKTFIYAYLYGAGNLKLGTIIYDDMAPEARAKFNQKYAAGTPREKALVGLGLRARKRIEEGLPALGKVQAAVKRAAERGTIKTLDGAPLRVRSAHSALNTLLQGGGAVLMKKALVLFEDALLEAGWSIADPLSGAYVSPDGGHFGFVANIHDEFQCEVSEDDAETIGRMAADAIKRAGEAFGLRCAMAGAFQIGRTWADSH